MIKRGIKLFLLLALLPLVVVARQYNVTATGSMARDSSPSVMGINMGFANEASNIYTWLRYLNPQQGRQFVPPLQKSNSAFENTYDWRSFAGNVGVRSRSQVWGDQFGVSFKNETVGTMDLWIKAVNELRDISDKPKEPNFIDWIYKQPAVGWSKVINFLNTTGKGASVAQVGNPTYALTQLQKQNYKTIALWDIRCRNFNYTTMDRENPEYWKERWETYRLFYLAGRWFSELNITNIELYNEPDKDTSCLTPEYFADDVRVRSTALRDAFDDYNLWSGEQVYPYLIAPATSQAWSEGFSNAMLDVYHLIFPYGYNDDNYAVANAYSFHKYGSFSKNNCNSFSEKCRNEGGYSLASSYDRVEGALVARNDSQFPVWVTELNCFTSSTAENTSHDFFNGKHIMDEPLTSACLAAQIGSIVGRDAGGPSELSVFKMVQTLKPASKQSSVVKNGLFYGSIFKPPFDVTGSTKTGEAYRMLLRKIPQDRHNNVWSFATQPARQSQERFTVYAVDDSTAYYIYSTNEEWITQNVSLNLTSLPGVDPNSNLIVSATAGWSDGTSAHGEVIAMQLLTTSFMYEYVMPPGSFYMITAPKVQTAQLAVIASDAVSVRAGANSLTNYDQQPVVVATSTTNADDTAVALFKINPIADGYVANLQDIVSAVFSLHLSSSTDVVTPQVLTVLAFTQPWTGMTAVWEGMQFLKPLNDGVTDTTTNFIQWNKNFNPSVAGMLTVQPGANDKFLRLDVTDAVRAGAISFAVVRMLRYDSSTAGPIDAIQGTYTFDNMGAAQDALKPQLLIDLYRGPAVMG